MNEPRNDDPITRLVAIELLLMHVIIDRAVGDGRSVDEARAWVAELGRKASETAAAIAGEDETPLSAEFRRRIQDRISELIAGVSISAS